MPAPSHQCLPAAGALAQTTALRSPCAAAMAAPHKPPTNAWLELEGSPTYQVSRFHRIAPTKAQISMCEDEAAGTTRVSTRPDAMVLATAAPTIEPARLVKVASKMAWRGVNTFVPTTVAMELAVS